MQLGIAGMVGEIDLAPTYQAVDDADFISAIKQEIDNVTSNEAGAAGDDSNLRFAHATSTVFIFCTLKYSGSSKLLGRSPRANALQRSRTASSTVCFGR